MISVVLMEPGNSGNIGAIARAMANFDLKKLIIINPKCNIDEDARRRSKHALQLLKKAKIRDKSILKKFDYVIGTTAVIGTDYNVPRCPLTPEQLAEKLATLGESCKKSEKGKKAPSIAILFGREGEGLHNDEIEECDFIVTIPTGKSYPTMNISHSAAIIFYAIFKAESMMAGKAVNRITERIIFAKKQEKDLLMKHISQTLDSMDFSKEKKLVQERVWKKIIGKSMPTKRELFALFGFFKKARSKK
jgi:TrmH family RNA methyltransferase